MEPRGGGFAVGGGHAVTGGAATPALAFDVATGGVTRLPLPGPASGVLSHLLRAYLLRDKTRVGELLRVIESASLGSASGAIPLDFVFDGEAPIAVATSAGLAWPGGEGGPERQRLAFDAMPWRLWLDPDGTLPSALSRYLDPPEQPILLEALIHCAGNRLPQLALAAVRGRSEALEAENVRALFDRAGREAAADVVRAMGDKDPAVALLATFAAGAERVARRLLGPDLRPSSEERLRASLRAADPRLRSAALELLVRDPRDGFAEALGVALADGASMVRSAALRAVRRAPDHGAIVSVVVAAVQRETREEEKLAGLHVLGDLADPAADLALIEATGDASPPVRATAALQLQSKAHGLSAPVAHEALDRTLLLAVAAGEARRNGLVTHELTEGLSTLWSATRMGLARAHVIDGGASFPPVLVLETVARRLFPDDLGPVDEEEGGPSGKNWLWPRARS